MASVIIREPEHSDRSGLIAVYGSEGFFDYSPSRLDLEIVAATVDAYLIEFVSAPASIIFYVADLNSELAGFSIARKTAQATWEVQAGVHFDHRKQGIGTALLAKVFTQVHSRGPAVCEAIVHAGNLGSIKMVSPFFQEHGEFEGLPGFLRFRSSW
ncbi:GNAT family N-acetyltransferase [Rhizobium sp. FKY42]|uniref:GNAT family N-acetyltransferase n=1 Tax=Rhizobium sp. FKY42 TaxID=2562310 RepID=UPI0010C05942|nr:GNAT family N-acetyltransferase [Rhizobium sp. FKY42]